MFDGKVATSKSYNIKRRGGDATNRNRGNFVEQARADREARALEKLRQRSATSIQASARRWRIRLLTFIKLRAEMLLLHVKILAAKFLKLLLFQFVKVVRMFLK